MLQLQHLTDEELMRWAPLDERYLLELGRRQAEQNVTLPDEIETLEAEVGDLREQLDELEEDHRWARRNAVTDLQAASNALMNWTQNVLGIDDETKLPDGLREALGKLRSALSHLN